MELNDVPDEQETIDPQSLIDELTRYQALIPDYAHLTNEAKLALRKAASLDPDWVVLAVNAIGACSTVQGAARTTAEQLRSDLSTLDLWRSAESNLSALLQGVATANLIRRHRIGLKVLMAYGLIRHLVREPEHSALIPYYERLKQMNRMGKRKKKDEGL